MSLAQFQATPLRRPPTGATIGSVLGLLGLCTIIGGLVGLLVGGVKHLYWLVLLFPLFFGGLAALGCLGAVVVTKTHGRALALAAAIWTCVAVGLAMHAVMNHRACGTDGLAPGSFARCLDFRAQAGVTAKHGDHLEKDRANVLGPGATYAYWGVELLLITLFPMLLAYLAAVEPFCGRCRRWMRPRHLGALSAPAPPARVALRTGDLEFFRSASPRPRDEKQPPSRLPTGGLALSMWACTRCGVASPIVLRLYAGPEGPTALPSTLAAEAQYPGEAIPVVEQLFAKT